MECRYQSCLVSLGRVRHEYDCSAVRVCIGCSQVPTCLHCVLVSLSLFATSNEKTRNPSSSLSQASSDDEDGTRRWIPQRIAQYNITLSERKKSNGQMGVVFRVRAADLRRSTDEVDLFPFAVEKDGWFHRIIPIYIFMSKKKTWLPRFAFPFTFLVALSTFPYFIYSSSFRSIDWHRGRWRGWVLRVVSRMETLAGEGKEPAGSASPLWSFSGPVALTRSPTPGAWSSLLILLVPSAPSPSMCPPRRILTTGLIPIPQPHLPPPPPPPCPNSLSPPALFLGWFEFGCYMLLIVSRLWSQLYPVNHLCVLWIVLLRMHIHSHVCP